MMSNGAQRKQIRRHRSLAEVNDFRVPERVLTTIPLYMGCRVVVHISIPSRVEMKASWHVFIWHPRFPRTTDNTTMHPWNNDILLILNRLLPKLRI